MRRRPREESELDASARDLLLRRRRDARASDEARALWLRRLRPGQDVKVFEALYELGVRCVLDSLRADDPDATEGEILRRAERILVHDRTHATPLWDRVRGGRRTGGLRRRGRWRPAGGEPEPEERG